ncbi:hypothetical protein [Escherichia coli]|nr:hypothetical protein [Escherichia coli]
MNDQDGQRQGGCRGSGSSGGGGHEKVEAAEAADKAGEDSLQS